MSEEKKTNKRKLFTRYLILAVCILVLAAITVTVVFAANDWFRTEVNLEGDGGNNSGNDNNAGGNDNILGGNTAGDNNGDTADTQKPSGSDNTGDTGNDKPATSVTEFACPVSSVDVINVFDFGKDITLGHYHFHTGLDMAGEVGTAVMACLDGTVESIVVGDQLDGTTVTLSHANGLKTVYSFIDAAEGLKKGDTVKRGDTIGCIAEPNGSEFMQGAHLHFEVYENGELANPEDFLDVSSK